MFLLCLALTPNPGIASSQQVPQDPDAIATSGRLTFAAEVAGRTDFEGCGGCRVRAGSGG